MDQQKMSAAPVTGISQYPPGTSRQAPGDVFCVRLWRRAAMLLALSIGIWSALVSHAEAHAALPQKGSALVMVEEAGCGYCARWLAEVGPGYPLSDEGKVAPLHRRDRFDPEVRRFGRLIYTPTFVLIHDGEERGRILGYPGADFFWSMIGELVAKLPQRAEAGGAAR